LPRPRWRWHRCRERFPCARFLPRPRGLRKVHHCRVARDRLHDDPSDGLPESLAERRECLVRVLVDRYCAALHGAGRYKHRQDASRGFRKSFVERLAPLLAPAIGRDGVHHGRQARHLGDRVDDVAEPARGAVVAPARPAHEFGRAVGAMLRARDCVDARTIHQTLAAHVTVPTKLEETGQKKFVLLNGWNPGKLLFGGVQ